jgi:hypothetical protein
MGAYCTIARRPTRGACRSLPVSTPTSSPPPDDNGPKSRLDREIEEILARNDTIRHLPPPPKAPRANRVTVATPRVPPTVRRLLGVPIFLSFVIAIAAYLVRDISPLFANILATAAVACIIWPIIERFRRPASAPPIQVWRGQVYHSPSRRDPSPLDSVRQWWSDRRR